MRTRGLASFVAATTVQLFMLAGIAAAANDPRISLDVSEGRILPLPAPAASVFLADPAIADVQVPTPNRVFIFGKKVGRTTLFALGADGRQLTSVNVDVHQPLSTTQGVISSQPGAAGIKASSTDNAIMLQGTAPDQQTASDALRTTNDFSPDKGPVDNRTSVASPSQVMIKVWIGEVDRSVNKQLGINWDAAMKINGFNFWLVTGRTVFDPSAPSVLQRAPSNAGSLVISSSNLFPNSTIDALASEGLVTTLAEPNLTALSGEPASFLAGGEFPIPVAQALGTVTLDFKTYGVSLAFVPTVMAPNHINLKVRPEVSQIDQSTAVELDGVSIPGLTVRRAETTIELGSGQSFAIAGLLQNVTQSTIDNFPGLANLPVIGALFRSSSFIHNESELVIIVTPYIVKPVDDPNKLQTPFAGLAPANDIERIYRGRAAALNGGSGGTLIGGAPGSLSVLTTPRLAGDAGFDME